MSDPSDSPETGGLGQLFATPLLMIDTAEDCRQVGVGNEQVLTAALKYLAVVRSHRCTTVSYTT